MCQSVVIYEMSRYRLEDPRGLRTGKSPYCSPRGSLSMDIAQRLLRKELRDRSYSDDTQSDSGSPEFCFLHPDHAWVANSRRGSSQSEQLEVEPYELSRDYSRSLPGSRRSSFQSQGGTDSKREYRHEKHSTREPFFLQREYTDASVRGSFSSKFHWSRGQERLIRRLITRAFNNGN